MLMLLKDNFIEKTLQFYVCVSHFSSVGTFSRIH